MKKRIYNEGAQFPITTLQLLLNDNDKNAILCEE